MHAQHNLVEIADSACIRRRFIALDTKLVMIVPACHIRNQRPGDSTDVTESFVHIQG